MKIMKRLSWALVVCVAPGLTTVLCARAASASLISCSLGFPIGRLISAGSSSIAENGDTSTPVFNQTVSNDNANGSPYEAAFQDSTFGDSFVSFNGGATALEGGGATSFLGVQIVVNSNATYSISTPQLLNTAGGSYEIEFIEGQNILYLATATAVSGSISGVISAGDSLGLLVVAQASSPSPSDILPDYSDVTTEVSFNAVPEPSSGIAIFGGVLLLLRRTGNSNRDRSEKGTSPKILP